MEGIKEYKNGVEKDIYPELNQLYLTAFFKPAPALNTGTVLAAI